MYIYVIIFFSSALSVRVVLGAHNLLVNEPTKITLNCNSTIINEDWDSVTLRNDIALVELPYEVELSGKESALD